MSVWMWVTELTLVLVLVLVQMAHLRQVLMMAVVRLRLT